jgi:central kinetochore subunit Mis15/CHL4
LGIWTPYADGTVDISPFDDVLNHESFKELPTIEDTDDRIKKIAMLRFKGSLDPLKSKKLYVDVENSDVEEEKRYKRRKLIGDDVDDNEEERNVDKSEFSSLTPIQFIDFEISNEYKNFLPKVKIKLQGNDIFAGLHELSVNGTINPETIPGWLTGEEGLNSGVIEDHLFVEKTIPASASNDLI